MANRKAATTWAEHCKGKPGYDPSADYKGLRQGPAPAAAPEEPDLGAEIDEMSPGALKKALEELEIEPASGKGSTDANREKLRAALG